MHNYILSRSTSLVALSIFCLFFSSLVAGDRLVVLRRPSRGRKLVLKNLRLRDTDVNYFPLSDWKTDRSVSPFIPKGPLQHEKTVSREAAAPSVPRRLLQPFEAALRPSPSSPTRPEIETEKLLEACRELKEAMNAVGQDRNAAEIERNLQKFEHLHRMAPPGRRETLRSLLEYEKELGVHQNGRLKDPSGAMGLLWIRRSLAFQERLYSLILEKPMQTNEAALQAYHETLEPYHGWALQQIYSLALKKTTPPRHEMFQKLCALPENRFGATEEQETVQDLRKLCETWKPLLHTWEETFQTLGLEDYRKV